MKVKWDSECTKEYISRPTGTERLSTQTVGWESFPGANSVDFGRAKGHKQGFGILEVYFNLEHHNYGMKTCFISSECDGRSMRETIR